MKQSGKRCLRAALCALVVMLLGAPEADPWSPADLIQPEALAKPMILCVGFQRLYAATRLPGAQFAGPAGTPAGLDALRQTVAAMPRGERIVIYCGCCPLDHCPNVRPAFRLLRELNFRNAKVLYIPTNMHTDWTEKGYPVERP
jgi:hypothetical protein